MSQSFGLRKINDDNTLSIVLVEGSVSQVLKTKQGSNLTLHFFALEFWCIFVKWLLPSIVDQVCKKPSLKIADSFNLKFVSLQDNRYKIFFNFQKSILYWEDNLTEQTMMTTQANLWRAFSPSMKYRTPWTVDSCPKSKMQKIKI